MSLAFATLLLNPATKSQINIFTEKPSGGLLLNGKTGSGKKYLARHIAVLLMDENYVKVQDSPQLIIITKPEDKSEIPIDLVRQAINKLSLRVATTRPEGMNRTLIIEDAHFLSIEAQNALLKLLEEPPQRTIIILTVDSEYNLLPTVVSRTQRISVIPPSLEQSLNFFDKQTPAEVKSAYMLSQGSVALMEALLTDDADHPLRIAVGQAKQFISNDSYAKLIQMQKISKDKQVFETFLDGLARVLAALQADSINKSNHSVSKKLLLARQAAEESISQLEHSVNPRIIALKLALDSPV